MANPQKENGHVDIVNEIVEALAKIHLSGYENRILWSIFRKTYGWHKKEDWITNSQIAEMTGIADSHVSRTIKILIKRKIVTKIGKKLGFQKDYDQWDKLPKLVTNDEKLPIQDKKLPELVKKVTNFGIHKRNYTKENTQKENVLCVSPVDTVDTVDKSIELKKEMLEVGCFEDKFVNDLFRKYPVEKIEKYFEELKYKEGVNNPVGWLVAALKNDYKEEGG
jgi:phage replication O-like protein O